MGYHTSPAVSFLLTIFNVRLGWWFGNPRHREKHRLSSPKVGLLYLVKELTGSANSSTGFVNLSDGGHFENLGVYELIRRRCRCIIVGDAEEDAALTFGALGGVIRKCRIDFNVDIEIVLDRIVRLPGEDRSVAHCVVADINYPADVNNPVPFAGKLIYLKSSITGDEPSDIREYNWRAEEFPHQTTGDQFFDESQFESYRALGYHIAKTALSQAATGKDFRDKAALERFLEGDYLGVAAAHRGNAEIVSAQHFLLQGCARSDSQVCQLAGFREGTVRQAHSRGRGVPLPAGHHTGNGKRLP